LDARNTANDPILLGPPTLEFAPYAKIPGSRVRKDARQGTIDQDPEFILFLESLTQPITRSGPLESAADGEDKKEAITTTPLVQYIKEKKANKAKEAASKSSRSRSEREPKSDKVQSKKLLQRPEKEASQPASAEKTEKRSRTDKATKEAVKAANKQAANVASKQAAKAATAQNSPKEPTQPAAERKRERGNVAAVGKILQRDLGLAPSSNRRRGGRGAAADGGGRTDQAASPSEAAKDTPTKSPRGGLAQDNKMKRSNTPQPSETPNSQRSETSTPAPATSTPKAPRSRGKQASAPTPPTPASTATQAFLKHANPSQGVTEPLLETAFAPFGKVLKVEIDKKKGFGYVDFAEPVGLQKAIAASPVTVAQSQVVVLERKANPSAEKGGRGKGRGGEAKPPPIPTGDSNKAGGGKPSEGGTGGGGTSSRSRRGGRGRGGQKNKDGGGDKGGGNGGGGNATASEQKPAETK
jgi:regulator of nonsense transcripts 3